MTQDGFAALVKAAKKEGHLNTIALPPDWANYKEALHNFPRKYGIGITNANPSGTSAQENEAIRSLKGDKRAPDAVDVTIPFAISGANEGLYAKYFSRNYKSIPRALKDTRGFWMGDYWGAVSIGYNKTLISNPPKTFKDLLKPEYKGKVAINGSPLTSGSAIAVVFASALANGGSLSDVSAGIDYWSKMKKSGNYIPVGTTPQTVASGQTPISLDWDYNNLAYVTEFPAASWAFNVPSDGVYGGYYAQAISATAPHPYAARLWEEYLYSDQGQIIWLKGGAHPARFADMVARKVIPQSVLASLPAAAIYTKVKFASLGQQTKAKNLIAQQWPTKVGG
jgi:putative spermidine/putrescine transport system substrate-binding protein